MTRKPPLTPEQRAANAERVNREFAELWLARRVQAVERRNAAIASGTTWLREAEDREIGRLDARLARHGIIIGSD